MKQNYTLRISSRWPSFFQLTLIVLTCLSMQTLSQAQVVLQNESFEGTIFPAPGWKQQKGNVNAAIGGNGSFSRIAWPSAVSPSISGSSGSNTVMQYNSFTALNGDTTLLFSKPYDFSNNGGTNPTMSFQMYRDNQGLANADKIEVFINTVPSMTGAVAINHGGGINYITRPYNNTPVLAIGQANTWQTYTFTLPAGTYTGKRYYFIFRATSTFGFNIYMDDFKINTYPSQLFAGDVSFDLVYQNTISIGKPTTNAWIVGIKCAVGTTLGSGCGNVSLGTALKLDSLLLNTNGCTNVNDIQNAKIWYTGGYNQFSIGYVSPFPGGLGQTGLNFGQNIGVPATNLDFTNQAAPCFYLEYDSTYFWLTYDIKATAGGGNSLDADFRGANVGATGCPNATAGTGLNLTPVNNFSIPGFCTVDVPYCTPTYSVGTSFANYTINDFVQSAMVAGEPPSVIRIGTGIGGPPNNNAGLPASAGPGCVPNCNFTAQPPAYTLWPANFGTTAVFKLGSTYTINVQAGTWFSNNNIAVFLDLNHDGDFADAGEFMGQQNLSANAIQPISIVVPAGPAYTGNTRLRVREVFAVGTPMSPCNQYTYGECEDFTVTIIPDCSPLYKLWLGNTNDWNNPSNWCGGVPTINDDVVIDKLLANQSGAYFMPTILTGVAANCKNIRIAATDTLFINAPTPATLALKIKGDLQIDGGFSIIGTYYNAIPFSLGTIVNTLYTPFRSNAKSARMQFIYTVAEMALKGMVAGDTITGIQFTVAGKGSTSPFLGFQLRFENSAAVPAAFPTACIIPPTKNALVATQTLTGVATLGSPIITGMVSTSNLFVGMMVSAGTISIPAGLTIVSINGPTSVTLSGNAIGSGTTGNPPMEFATVLGLNTLPLTGGGTANYLVWDGINNLLLDFSYTNAGTIGLTNDVINITQTTGSKQTLLLTDNVLSGASLVGATSTPCAGGAATTSNNFWSSLGINRPNMTFLLSRPYQKTKVVAQGQWTNNGGFSAGYSEVKLDSNVVQNIQGTQSTTFRELNISKTAVADNVVLQKNTNVVSLLTLTSGQLRMNKKTLQVNDSATTAIARTAGYLISEDSLSKLNWASYSIAGSKIVPWGSAAVAAPTYIPQTLNITTPGPAGGANVGMLTLSTYYAASNVPFPPTVTHMNNISQTITTSITLGSTTATMASTANLVVGMPLTFALGFPAGTSVATIVNGTTFTTSAAATATNAAAGVVYSGWGSNDISSAVDRFWGIAKDGTGGIADITFAYPTADRPVSWGVVQGRAFPWRKTPTYYCSSNGTTTLSNFGSTATLQVGMAINGPGIPIGTVVSTIVNTTTITVSNSIGANAILPVTFPAIANNAAWVRTFTLIGQPAVMPVANGGTGPLVHTYSAGAVVDSVKIAAYNWPVSIGNNNPWTIAGNNSATALPIELLRFNANIEGDKVHLTWTTSSEKNNDYFTVERTTNTTDFDFIAKVNSYLHNSTSPMNYDAYDYSPKMGLSYYRLKQTDFDGSYAYSDYVPVNFGSKKRFEITSVNADVSNSSVDVMFYYDNSLPLTYTLMDVTGRIIVADEKMDNTIEGLNLLHIDKSLSNGLYTVILRNASGIQSRKFVY